MFLNNSQLKLKKAGLAFSLLFSFVLLSDIDVNAQGRGKSQGKYEKQREKIERKREKFEDKLERKQEKLEEKSERREDRWEDRDDDYQDRRDGDRRNDGYYGNNGGWGNNGSNIARTEGYRDGLAAGREDARDGDRYKPQSHRDYRQATDGYNRRLGSQGQYKQAYRAAFVQGYNEGFRSNNRNRNGNRNGRRGF